MAILGVFGDSITWGKSDKLNGGWVNLLRKYLEEQNLVWGVYNLGIDGDTSKGLLGRFKSEMSLRRIDHVMIAIGINDSVYKKEPENNEVPIQEYNENLHLLIQEARRFTPKIVFVGLTIVDESQSKPLSYSKTGKCYDNGVIQRYNKVMMQAAKEEGVLFIDCDNILKIEDSIEGVHLNFNGHRKMFEKIKEELIKKSFFV